MTSVLETRRIPASGSSLSALRLSLRSLGIVLGLCLSGLAAVELDLTSHNRFDAWLTTQAQQLRQGAAIPQGESDHGQTLARERRAAMRALMASNPRLAAARAIPTDLLNALPPAIRQHLERRESGIGRLLVACRMPEADHGHDTPGHVCVSHGEIVRELHMGGVTYAAYVFNRWQDAKCGDYQVAEALVLDGAAVLGTTEPVASATPPPDMAPLQAELPTNQLSVRKVLYYIAMFADETVYPLTAATVNSRMQVTSDFFRNNTQDQMYFASIKGTTDGGALMDIVYITLPSNASTYTSNFSGLLNDARTQDQAQAFA